MPSSGREEGGTCAPPPSDGPTPCASWPHRYLDSSERPTVGGERPHVTVTVDVQTLRNDHTGGRDCAGSGRCEPDHVGAVSPATARRLACDASVLPVVLGGPSEPLDVGRRTPVVSAGLRRAVVLRDQRCRFLACTWPIPGATPTTSCTGPTGGRPPCTTWCCCAVPITDWCTRGDFACSWSTAGRCSDGPMAR